MAQTAFFKAILKFCTTNKIFVIEFEEGIAAFVAMPDTWQIAQPKNLIQYKYEMGRTKSQNKLTTK